ncbi:antA/AntB antirepressor family protein [Rodentibacter pneumotropicus]|uniref:antA/AntB antirepressor family protein n=1 Tax=Rodentibacter pneumotropicus TaxID=758 RepID=UPI000985910F|nr:antA/AntB antirepressor family protein [Rodentibacter pneumotropicus]OOF62379.1 antirepressor [Rodentibacter pneumotropicus]THA19009.1 phage antirepressor Ant [Rodentibacter pneumotropicus]
MNTNQAKTEITALLAHPLNLFEGVEGINARDVHRLLKSKRHYSMWIKARIKQAGFIENQDFVIVQNSAIDLPKLASEEPDCFLRNKMGEQKETRGGHNRADYIITLDTAKHLCLMEKNEIGRAIRQHFIEAEKQLKQVAPKVYRNTLAKTQARLEAIDHNREMTDAIQAYYQRQGKAPKPHHFSINHELVDSLVLGENVRQWKAKHGILGRVRDSFNVNQVTLLKLLLKTNASLINLDMPYQERKAQLQKLSLRYLSEQLAA